MASSDHETVLGMELDNWSQKSYQEVAKLFDDLPVSTEIVHEGLTYWIKVVGLVNTEENIRLSIESNSELESGFFPASKQILFFPDGKIEFW